MNYEEAIQYIESLSPTLGRPGLERFRLFMGEHGNPQDSYPSLHVAGTNGKGSVVCMLAETLTQSGLKTGRYIGPHLMSYNERFEIDGKAISNDRLALLCSRLKDQSEAFGKRFPEHGALTWFELLTAIAFLYFAEESVDAAVFEVGLGGLYDATNVLAAPLVTAIVSIGLDHTHILGSTETEIAFEKAGIIKPGIPLVTACTGAGLEPILKEARAKNAPVICINETAKPRKTLTPVIGCAVDGSPVVLSADSPASAPELGMPQQMNEFIEISCGTVDKRELAYLEVLAGQLNEQLKDGINGPRVMDTVSKRKGYQRRNAALAAVVLALWELESGKKSLHKFDSALSSYFWPGRMQYFEKQQLLLDGAHNEAGAKALKESLDKLFPNKSRSFILSFYQSKRFREILAALLRPGDLVYASAAKGRRPVIAADEIISQVKELGGQGQPFDCLEDAFAAALSASSDKSIRVGTGSFATVSAGLNFLGYTSVEESRSQSRNF